MFLSSFSYKESKWELNNLTLTSSSCLIVGRNSTGKTRTIHALQNVVSFMQMKQIFFGGNSFSAEMVFTDALDCNYKMNYSFTVKDGIIDKESLIVNDEILIKRTSKTAKYKSDTINPPANKLIVQVRRDENAYPEIEQLMTWAEGVNCVSYSNINPFTIGPSQFINPISFSELVDSLDNDDKNRVLANSSKLNYNITSISTIKASESVKFVNVKEKLVSENIFDMQLSSGMLRTLYLLCYMEYIKKSSKVSLLLIDDMSEGLDYSRSTCLGRMIFDDCRQNGLQVIASSNDAFLMDVVDISNWQILSRVGSKVTSINQYTNPELFRKFKMTGLSNFDFFSSDFIDKYLSKGE